MAQVKSNSFVNEYAQSLVRKSLCFYCLRLLLLLIAVICLFLWLLCHWGLGPHWFPCWHWVYCHWFSVMPQVDLVELCFSWIELQNSLCVLLILVCRLYVWCIVYFVEVDWYFTSVLVRLFHYHRERVVEYPLYILCFKLHASDKETEMVITLCIFAPHWLVYECTTLRVTRSEPTACEPVVQRAVPQPV